MGIIQTDQQPGGNASAVRNQQTGLTPGQLCDLSDAKKQEQYQQAYRLQQARRSCPGCGDDGMSY
jgi:hypothetical protein